MSDRRRQRRNYLKMAKKMIGCEVEGAIFTNSDFEEMKRGFRNEGKRLRIEDLRESLEAEQDALAHKEGELREQYKAQGLKKKEIDSKIEAWYDKQKIWSLHSDVYDELV